jgi:hypothetical protein
MIKETEWLALKVVNKPENWHHPMEIGQFLYYTFHNGNLVSTEFPWDAAKFGNKERADKFKEDCEQHAKGLEAEVVKVKIAIEVIKE